MTTPGDFFEDLQNQLDKQLPFVAYRDATTPVIKAFLQKDKQLHIIHNFRESGFVFAPFDEKLEVILIPAEHSNFLQTIAEVEETETGNKILNEISDEDKNKEQHKKLVEKALEEINNGSFKKVVLSRKEIIKAENLDVLRIFKDLLQKYNSAFVYVWYHPEVGLWLGATPETLLHVERGKFKTMALAGTLKHQEESNPGWGDKEREEQQIVVDSILKDLENASVKNIRSSDAYTTKAGSLLHLRTDISGDLVNKSMGLKELINNIHPTPAVCGLPKESAKEFILEFENYNREFYTGYLGELNLKTARKRSSNLRNQENQAYSSISTSTSLFVNLRCMKIEGYKASIYIGGGITKDSEPEAEWEETKNKAETMKAVLVDI